MRLPKAKNNDILVQNVGDEVLVYDQITNKAYNLNDTSAKVYNVCDGVTTFDELKRKYKFTDDLIYLTLDELKKNDLIAEDYQSKFTGVSRREVIKRVGLASLVALPIITFVIAPKAAHAQSSTTCNIDDTCACSVTNPSNRPRFCELNAGFDGLSGTASGCNPNADSCLCRVNSNSSTGVCRFVTF